MHFAGAKSVAESLIKPMFYYDNNVAGTLKLINCAIKNDVANFIFSSSATVYGESEIMPVTEDCHIGGTLGNDSNLLIVFYVQIMPDDFVMQLHRF